MRFVSVLACLWLAAFADADVKRWGGPFPSSQMPAPVFTVFQIDTETQTATLASLPLGLPPIELKLEGEGWAVELQGQRFIVTGTGEVGGVFNGEITIGPLGPSSVSMEWLPLLRQVPGARAFSGKLDVPGMSLDVTIRLGTVDGSEQAEMDIPLQSLDAFPVHVTAVDGNTRTLVLDGPMPATMELTETPGGLSGSFKQGPVVATLDLKPVPVDVQPQRPQTPKPPFPYVAYELQVQHVDGHTLAGTLTIPKGSGPFPTAILISGSGAQDRDEALLGHKPFLVLSDHLSRNGIAVLRYDDRGVGGSLAGSSNLNDDTSAEYATDTVLWAKALAVRAEIDASHIGLIGHSEGGLIASIAASRNPELIDFIVLLSGPGVPGKDILTAQVESLLLASGGKPEVVASVTVAQQDLIDAVIADIPLDQQVKLMRELMRAQMALTQSDTGEAVSDDLVQASLTQMNTPWMRWFMTADPADYLAKVTCPVLALNGTLDLQVPVEQNLPVIERVVREAGGDVTAHRLEGLNHLFQPAIKGTVDEYPSIEITFDHASMKLISTWITSQTGGGP